MENETEEESLSILFEELEDYEMRAIKDMKDSLAGAIDALDRIINVSRAKKW